MASLVSPSMLESVRAELSKKTTPQLKDELKRVLQLTSGSLVRLATIVQILEDRGEDMTFIASGFLMVLRRIAIGELLPDLVIMFSSQPQKIIQASKMPVEEQKKVLNGQATIPDRKKSMPKPGKGYVDHRDTDDGIPGLATHGTPKDVGHMAASIILKSEQPEIAASALFEALVSAGIIKAAPAILPQPAKKKRATLHDWDE